MNSKTLYRIAFLFGAFAAFLLGVSSSRADTTLTFVDGNTVSGHFVYDATTNKIVSFAFTSTAFGGTTFDSSTGAGAIVLSNQDGDQVLGFDAGQSYGAIGELDIVLSCGGVANCIAQASNGNSFGVTAGLPNCPDPNSAATGFCIESGQQYSVPECLGICEDALASNQSIFLDVTDPPGSDVLYTLTLNTVSTGTVFKGASGPTGGSGGNVPEPGTLALSILGLAGAALKKRFSPAA